MKSEKWIFTQNDEAWHDWYSIYADPDDDKFVDCAVAANAKFIVTEDNHFNVLKNYVFPNVEIIKLDKIIQMI